MKFSVLLASLATLALGSDVVRNAQEDLSLTRRALNGDQPLAAAVPHLVARQNWADSDILQVSLVDGSVRYISYGALKRNGIPCSRRGTSFTNCRPAGNGNEWQRGCSAATRCRAVNA